MNNTAVAAGVVTLASGAVIGIAALYAVKRGIDFSVVIEKFEENKELFLSFVKNILDMGRDFIMRLYATISELVKEAIFKIKIKSSYC